MWKSKQQQQDIIPGMSRDRQSQLIRRSNLTEDEVKSLMKLYKVYDKTPKGTQGIPFQTFINMPDFMGHPFIARLTEMFVSDLENPVVYPEQFVSLASFLSSKAPIEQKRKLAFRMFDVNEDGTLGHDEVYRLYKMLYHQSLTDDQIGAITLLMMERPDLEEQWNISYNDFVKLVSDLEIQARFTIDVQPR